MPSGQSGLLSVLGAAGAAATGAAAGAGSSAAASPDGDGDGGLLLYDSKDLTTHAFCVGMTGSGKTGLCIGLLEEAAIDGVPAIVIDPKGDLTNLALSFPELRPEDFRPWIDEAAAARKGQSPDAYAAATASQWREGLARSGQDGARVQRFRDGAEVVIYTPGSASGRPVRVLDTLAAPRQAVRDDPDAMRERVVGTVTGLLTLLGVDADPVRSPAHILLSSILTRAWEAGQDLGLGELVRAIVDPPFDRVGVMDVETFFPSKDRHALARSLNGVLASPGFAAWMQGEPLDARTLLYGPEGKPRLSVLCIAHLNDTERMFFVTLLLNEVVSWMRAQSGSSSLRAVLYMDEVAGYLPPSQNPPSKAPMMTLLKQARAFGLGVVLASQNPVDIDYKALSNCGTWFLGRLQAERDVDRVIDGLMGATNEVSAALDRGAVRRTLSGLEARTFLLNNVHEDGPRLFRTRWALSYLSGPLSRVQIRRLIASEQPDAAKAATPAAPASEAGAPGPATSAVGVGSRVEVTGDGLRPVVPPAVPEVFAGGHAGARYVPGLLAEVRLHYVRKGAGVDAFKDQLVVTSLGDGEVGHVWDRSYRYDPSAVPLSSEPVEGTRFEPLPDGVANAARMKQYASALERHLYQSATESVWCCPELKRYSALGESKAEFIAGLQQTLREQRDGEVTKLQADYDRKREALMKRVHAAETALGSQRAQRAEAQSRVALDAGLGVARMLFGGRSRRSARTAIRAVTRASKESSDVARAEEELRFREQAVAALDAERADALRALADAHAAASPAVEEVRIRPSKSEIDLKRLALCWWATG